MAQLQVWNADPGREGFAAVQRVASGVCDADLGRGGIDLGARGQLDDAGEEAIDAIGHVAGVGVDGCQHTGGLRCGGSLLLQVGSCGAVGEDIGIQQQAELAGGADSGLGHRAAAQVEVGHIGDGDGVDAAGGDVDGGGRMVDVCPAELQCLAIVGGGVVLQAVQGGIGLVLRGIGQESAGIGVARGEDASGQGASLCEDRTAYRQHRAAGGAV